MTDRYRAGVLHSDLIQRACRPRPSSKQIGAQSELRRGGACAAVIKVAVHVTHGTLYAVILAHARFGSKAVPSAIAGQSPNATRCGSPPRQPVPCHTFTCIQQSSPKFSGGDRATAGSGDSVEMHGRHCGSSAQSFVGDDSDSHEVFIPDEEPTSESCDCEAALHDS